MTWRMLFLFLGMSCAAVGARVFLTATTVLGYVATIATLICSSLFLHVWSLQPADNLSLSGLCQAYFEQMICRVVGGLWLIKFNYICRDVETAQNKTLLYLLRKGQTTRYGQDHNMAEINSVEEFRSRMRLTTYEDYKAYVERCVGGEGNIFFQQEVDYFGATSGTTSGQSKLYPINLKQTRSHIIYCIMAAMATCYSAIPQLKKLKFIQGVWTPSRTQRTVKNVEKGSLSKTMLRNMYHSSTPREGYNIPNEHAGQYVQMLFALREPEVGSILTLTSSVLLMLFSLVENQWEKLVRDIRRGEIDKYLDIPEDIRRSLNKHLIPLPERADELEAIFRSGCKGMVPRIWPQMVVIMCLCQGTFALQTRVVRERYVGPNIMFICTAHMSTEGSYGLVLFDEGLRWPDTGEIRDDYVILSNMNFYEFIPVEQVEEDQPRALLAEQVEVGKEYELVITSSRGLYRFRTGDVIRIIGYRGNTPTYQMLQRVGDIVNVHLEKVPEVVLREAMDAASGRWKSGELVNFAVSENVNVERVTGESSGKLFYVIFIETDSDQPLLEEEKLSVDVELCRISDTYRAYRTKGTITPPWIIQVRSNSFEELRTLASEKNPLLYRLQYKHPRVVRNGEKIALLMKNAI